MYRQGGLSKERRFKPSAQYALINCFTSNMDVTSMIWTYNNLFEILEKPCSSQTCAAIDVLMNFGMAVGNVEM